EGDVSFVAMAPLASMEPKTAVEWLVEVRVPADAKPGNYGGLLYVRAGDVGIDRVLLAVRVWSATLGGCGPAVAAADRLSAWKGRVALAGAAAGPPDGARHQRRNQDRGDAEGETDRHLGECVEAARVPRGDRRDAYRERPCRADAVEDERADLGRAHDLVGG